ncbi:AAA family ATPase [Streptacidiphilus sp. N1-3]|uniref:AAA family ATPase n=1 Tax=Streptacidiphilus alkalitolerans TaxID=3342712 RepID=A0ABV6X884_9ACTN
MTHSAPQTPADQSDYAVGTVLADLDRLADRPNRGVVVDSPPGAGKSTLVVRAAAHLARADHSVMIVAQTNEQVDDLVDRLATRHPDLVIGRILKSGGSLAERLHQHANVTGAERIDGFPRSPRIAIATAAKWAYIQDKENHWPWAIVDEAYQMRSDALLACAGLFDKALFVGDPGQLDPFSTVETERWTGLTWDPLRNAVDVTLAHNPDMDIRRLPVSWRLPASAAPLVERAFYPFTPFVSGTQTADRQLRLTTRALNPDATDRVLSAAAETGWGYLELPGGHTLRTDRGIAAALAATAERLLVRGATTYCDLAPPPVGRFLTPERIAIGVAHNDQAEAVRAHLPPALRTITVDTANKLQGREFDVTLVWHPLSGRVDASAFHLETGRLCVLLSRHRHACIVVARAGIRELLDRHPSNQPVHLDVPPKFPDGWRAHQTVMEHLEAPAHRVASD